jgi:hypothetical protein
MPPTQPTEQLATPAAAREVERLPPEPRPEGQWWDNPWPAILIGILALIVGGVVGYALGNKGETSTEAQRGGGPAITDTITHTTTVVKPKVVVRTNTVTANNVTQTPAPANSQNEERRIEAETNLRRAERENEELKRQLEGR